jgi:hypothetical protein
VQASPANHHGARHLVIWWVSPIDACRRQFDDKLKMRREFSECPGLRSHQALLVIALLALFPPSLLAQVNSWTKPTSGYWEEKAHWSLGVLPDSSQSVLFNNPGWKALAIGTNTTQNFPDSMRIQELQIGSPVDSYNVLLMNFSGFELPLQSTLVSVSSNSAFIMQSSALEVVATTTDGSTGNLLLGGTFNQGDYSQVKVHGLLDVGRRTHGAYFLTNGTLFVRGGEYIGGGGPGRFVQYGGLNHAGEIEVNIEGEFQLYGGDVTATNGITVGYGDWAASSSFYQHGGSVNADTLVNGNYILNGGNLRGRMAVPSPNDYQREDGGVLQNGGTNFAVSLDMGLSPNRFGGMGYYVLSNGVVRVDSSLRLGSGKFSQYNGLHTIAHNLVLAGTDMGMGIATADYLLAGGTFSADGITAQGATFQQDGGTNLIAGDIVFNAVPRPGAFQSPLVGRYLLGGGFVSTRNVILNATYYGGIRQTGGVSQITEKLTVLGVLPGSFDYTLEGGTLLVKNIHVGSGGFFQHTGGSIVHSGVLTLDQGEWRAATGEHTLGPLRLAASQPTNSAISFPGGTSDLRLANSTAQPWTSSATLYITNWQGSVSGGGQAQLFFGTSSDGLTAQQLALIKFSLPEGVFPARILATGEVVPDTLPPTGRIPPLLSLSKQSDATTQIIVRGDSNANYGLDISINLLDWTRWTNVSTPQGTATVTDAAATNAPQRFYRALLLP